MAFTFTQKLYPVTNQSLGDFYNTVNSGIFDENDIMRAVPMYSLLTCKPVWFKNSTLNNGLLTLSVSQESDHVAINHVFADGGEFMIEHILKSTWFSTECGQTNDVTTVDVTSDYPWLPEGNTISISLYNFDGSEGDYNLNNYSCALHTAKELRHIHNMEIVVSDAAQEDYASWLTYYKDKITNNSLEKALLHDADTDYSDTGASWAYDATAGALELPESAPAE